ncbi:hypothetical protein BOO86_15345 [Mycobacterium sp. CBMA 234]|uniref:PaaI family thioesterase n=1 Tax=Mycolicibacterium sp. CBMA 234 TaxID=1918495 RepID=UPI00139103A4|nr:PaaI family thioesterase [Mycolicibacterium sp. CBMA 234]MUL65849.1 hypothetical protein [Mycolicibacterium sp. CBMA 234]
MTTSADDAVASTAWWDPAPDVDWVAWGNSLPFAQDIGMECVALDRDCAVFRMEKSVLTLNPNGAVNGGLLAAAADQVMGALSRCNGDRGDLPATATLHIQYHLPAMPPLTFRATSLGGGRNIKFIEVVVLDAGGNRCATSTGTMAAGRLPLPRQS